MSKKSESTNEQERIIRNEQKNNPTGNFNDSLNKAQSGMPNTSGMSLKEVGGIILFLIVIFLGYSLYNVFF